MQFEIKLLLNEDGIKVTGLKEKEFFIDSPSEADKEIEKAINEVFPAPNLIDTYTCKKILTGIGVGSKVSIYGYADDMKFGEVIATSGTGTGIYTQYTVLVIDEYGKDIVNNERMRFDISGTEIGQDDASHMHWIEPIKPCYVAQYQLYANRDRMIDEIRERVNMTEAEAKMTKEKDPSAAKTILTELTATQLNAILDIFKGK